MTHRYDDQPMVFRRVVDATGEELDPVLDTKAVALGAERARPIGGSLQAEQQAAQPFTQVDRDRALKDLREAIMNNLGGNE